MSDAARDWLRLTMLLVGLTVLATLAGRAAAGETDDGAATAADARGGELLFQRDCAVCHGDRGGGTENGPDITAEGTASIDFQMRTRRMPIPTADTEIDRGVARRADGTPVTYSEQEIAAVVAYAEAWTTGPAVPDLDAIATGERDLAEGGELWRLNCAVCHQLAGQGGALLADVEVPGVMTSTELELFEATRVGPYSMPAFDVTTISDEQLLHLTAYVEEELQTPQNPGGWGAGMLGPFAEGAVVWVLGVLTLLLGAAWIGRMT